MTTPDDVRFTWIVPGRAWTGNVPVGGTDGSTVRDLALTFAAVGDPVRLQLMRYLLEDDHCVAECTAYVGIAQSGVSKHLGKLIDAGLVERRPAGRRNYHRVIDPATVRQLLHAAEQLHKR